MTCKQVCTEHSHNLPVVMQQISPSQSHIIGWVNFAVVRMLIKTLEYFVLIEFNQRCIIVMLYRTYFMIEKCLIWLCTMAHLSHLRLHFDHSINLRLCVIPGNEWLQTWLTRDVDSLTFSPHVLPEATEPRQTFRWINLYIFKHVPLWRRILQRPFLASCLPSLPHALWSH